MPSRSALDEYSEAMDEMVRLADRELDELFKAHRQGRLLKGELIEEMKRLTSVLGDVASHAALEYYEAERAALYPGGDGAPRVIPRPYSGKYVEKKIGPQVDAMWDDPERLSASMRAELERMIRNQGRRTIRENAGADPKRPRYARVPRGSKTCTFCYMLAGRGWVYESEDTAGLHNKFHKKCDCRIVPSWEGKKARLAGYNPEEMEATYKAARASAERKSGGRKVKASDIQAEMRRKFPDRFTDGVGDGGRSGGGGRGRTQGADDKYPRKLQPGTVREGRVKGTDSTIELRKYDTWRNHVIEAFNALKPEERVGRLIPERDPVIPRSRWEHESVSFSDARLNHILFSDKSGGGHLPGYGWITETLLKRDSPTTEFPAEWTGKDVEDAVRSVLKQAWSPGVKGEIEGSVNGLSVRVVVSKKGDNYRVITAYPLFQ